MGGFFFSACVPEAFALSTSLFFDFISKRDDNPFFFSPPSVSRRLSGSMCILIFFFFFFFFLKFSLFYFVVSPHEMKEEIETKHLEHHFAVLGTNRTSRATPHQTGRGVVRFTTTYLPWVLSCDDVLRFYFANTSPPFLRWPIAKCPTPVPATIDKQNPTSFFGTIYFYFKQCPCVR